MTQFPPNHPDPSAAHSSYASSGSLPRLQRPAAVSLLASLGIVVGCLLFFCNMLVMVTEARMASNPAYSPVPAAPALDPGVMKIYAINAALGTLFGGVLIGTSLAALSLQPAARTLVMIWSVGFVLWGVGRTIGEINYAGPANLEWVAKYRPDDPNFASGRMNTALVPKAIGVMVLYCVLPTLYMIFWNRPEVKSAFAESASTRTSRKRN